MRDVSHDKIRLYWVNRTKIWYFDIKHMEHILPIAAVAYSVLLSLSVPCLGSCPAPSVLRNSHICFGKFMTVGSWYSGKEENCSIERAVDAISRETFANIIDIIRITLGFLIHHQQNPQFFTFENQIYYYFTSGVSHVPFFVLQISYRYILLGDQEIPTGWRHKSTFYFQGLNAATLLESLNP